MSRPAEVLERAAPPRPRARGRRIAIAAIALVVAVLLVLLGIAVARGSDATGPGPTGPVGGALAGKPAPALAGTTLAGDHFRLRPGRVTVVNIWASWCGPCREELPTLVQVHRHWQHRGVRLVTIDTKDGPVAARSFLHRLHVTDLLAISDPEGRLAVAWGATGVPETVVVDRHGTIRARWLGAVPRDWLNQELQRWTGS
jgi:cytochrome c biogenesis protein CcmG/thiol:disulfide interchange protein DsbE